MEIDLSQINAFAIHLGQAHVGVIKRTHVIVVKTAFDIERDAKLFAPVDTGNLRNSISHDITAIGGFSGGSIVAVIGPTAEYGAYVELGTSVMAPHAYLGPAFDRHVGYFETAVMFVFDGILDGR